MTQEAFIEILKEKGYSYKLEGDKLIVTGDSVYLGSLETLPPDVEFKNEGDVFFRSLETIPSGVHFKNGVNVYLNSLKSISPGVEFKNGGDILLGVLGWVEDNEGIEIEGVENKRLLNLMISKGVFI